MDLQRTTTTVLPHERRLNCITRNILFHFCLSRLPRFPRMVFRHLHRHILILSFFHTHTDHHHPFICRHPRLLVLILYIIYVYKFDSRAFIYTLIRSRPVPTDGRGRKKVLSSSLQKKTLFAPLGKLVWLK